MSRDESFLKANNFSQFFISEDSFNNLNYQLIVTLNKRYKCTAGCDICYLQDKWIGNEDFKSVAQYTEENLNPEWEENLFNFAENFVELTTMDDMRYLKKNFKYQYNFYKKYSEEFSLSSLTNQAMFYHMPIMMNEMRFKDIYEITFSDVFLYHNHKKIIKLMKRILSRYWIRQIKLVMTVYNLNEKQRQIVKNFKSFLHDEGIELFRHHDVNGDYYKVDDAAHAMYSEGDKPVPILNQALYLAFDDVYMELEHFTPGENKFRVCCLNHAQDFSFLLARTLKTKLDIYKYNALTLQNKDSQFVKYFEHCGKTFSVNEDYNFIPEAMIPWETQWKEKMILEGGWEDHPGLGLLKTGTTNVKSIIELET